MAQIKRTVLLTDHPWPDVELEQALTEAAGHTFVAGPAKAQAESQIEALVARTDPSAILTCWAPVSRRALEAPTGLAVVSRIGVGLDNIDVPAATRRGTWVTNVPDYCVGEVSDHAIALLLSSLRGVTSADRDVKAAGWHIPTYQAPRISELTVAVVGYGRIGRETARKLRAFGCRVLVNGPHIAQAGIGEEIADRCAVQQQADAIILHAPLVPETRAMIDMQFIAGCARQPLIVNVSRGGLIDNAALEAALDTGAIRGAALDVVDGEPDPPSSLLEHPRVVVTPHIAYRSVESMTELRRRACEEALRVLAGEQPHSPCNNPRPSPK